jgi:hypothetical protein
MKSTLKIKKLFGTKLLRVFEKINYPNWKEYREEKILKSNLRRIKQINTKAFIIQEGTLK